jgi:flagellar motility protein MotE (MotC chaperone)
MDSKVAARAIMGMQDNVARDLIYALKKKKAAEVLSFMPVEKVTKLLGNH